MRWKQIIEAAIPFSKTGNTTGLTFGFESELIADFSEFYEEVFFEDGDDLLSELYIDRDDFDRQYQDWLDDDNEGDYLDWINDVGVAKWWKELDLDSYLYFVKDNEIVRRESWGTIVDNLAERMKEELNINNIITASLPETQRKNKKYDNTWYIEGDGSLYGNYSNDEGFEVISQIFHSYDEFINMLKKYFDLINEYDDALYTNKSTGLHINIGMPDAANKIDPLKLLLFSGEKWVTELWRNGDNEYTKELLPKLSKEGLPRSPEDASTMVKEILKKSMDKAFAINFLTLFEKGYVEFRPIGNTGYNKRIDEVINHINRFVQLINIASDPNMYRKEYVQKLGKLIGHTPTDKSKTWDFNKRLIVNWLKTTRLTDKDKNRIIDENGNIVIKAPALISVVSLYDVPPVVLRLLIKQGNVTVPEYEDALEYFKGKTYIIDEEGLEKAKAILDPLKNIMKK